MAVVQTITYKNSNVTYESWEDSLEAVRVLLPDSYRNHLDNWQSKCDIKAQFDTDSQTLTLIRIWPLDEDYESYKIGVPDRDGLLGIFDTAGWSINIEEEYT